jgi:hypothetical protein
MGLRGDRSKAVQCSTLMLRERQRDTRRTRATVRGDQVEKVRCQSKVSPASSLIAAEGEENKRTRESDERQQSQRKREESIGK